MALTAATKAKIDDFTGQSDLTISEIKLVLKHWDDVPRKIHASVTRSVKALDHIPPAIQLQLLDLSEKAVAAIGSLMCEEGQDLILRDYKEDVPSMVRHVPEFKNVSVHMWAHLAKAVKAQTLRPVLVKRLIARKDCPPAFAKAAGYTRDMFEKAQLKDRVARKPRVAQEEEPKRKRAAKTVKVADNKDFDFPREVASHARTVRRPRV